MLSVLASVILSLSGNCETGCRAWKVKSESSNFSQGHGASSQDYLDPNLSCIILPLDAFSFLKSWGLVVLLQEASYEAQFFTEGNRLMLNFNNVR